MGVTIWFARDGGKPTYGGPAYVMPLRDCIERAGLKRSQWISPPDRTPRFGDASLDSAILGFRYVVCEIKDDEAKAGGLRAGFYRLELAPDDAVSRLGTPRDPMDF